MDHRTALIVVDVQRGFINRHTRSVVPRIVRLVEGWRATGAPVVFTRFHNAIGSPYEKITGWTKLRTAEEQALVDELVPFADQAEAIIDKAQSSAFTPEGSELFREAGWTSAALCGIDTDACVYDSAISAYQGGIRPWLVTDACASTGGSEFHEAALLLASRNIGRDQLVTSSEALARIGGTEEACA